MTTFLRYDPRFRRVRGLAVLTALLAATCQVRGDDDSSRKYPDGITPITKEHLLTKVPNFFCFDYPFQPQPGKRLWLRIDATHFIERYPDGTESQYEVLGHAQARDMTGTIVVKLAGDPNVTGTDNTGTFQVFIPDKGNKEMAILFRISEGAKGEWRDMAWSLNKKTILQKVE